MRKMRYEATGVVRVVRPVERYIQSRGRSAVMSATQLAVTVRVWAVIEAEARHIAYEEVRERLIRGAWPEQIELTIEPVCDGLAIESGLLRWAQRSTREWSAGDGADRVTTDRLRELTSLAIDELGLSRVDYFDPGADARRSGLGLKHRAGLSEQQSPRMPALAEVLAEKRFEYLPPVPVLRTLAAPTPDRERLSGAVLKGVRAALDMESQHGAAPNIGGPRIRAGGDA